MSNQIASMDDVRMEFVRRLSRAQSRLAGEGVPLPDTVEILGAHFSATEPSIFGKVNEDYVRRELAWFESRSLCVDDLEEPIPQIWKRIMSPNRHMINSNYGWCVWSEENFDQYSSCFAELITNPASRRACMIYQRPSMQLDYRREGMNDFLCTNAVHVFIRNDQLHYLVQMRSNDAVYGYKADYAWHNHVRTRLLKDLVQVYPDLKLGVLLWTAASLHVYARHYPLITRWAEEKSE